MRVSGQHHAPGALPPRMSPYPLCRRLGGPQVLSGRVRISSLPPGVDLRTVEPVVGGYTDYTIPAPVTAVQITKIWISILTTLQVGVVSN